MALNRVAGGGRTRLPPTTGSNARALAHGAACRPPIEKRGRRRTVGFIERRTGTAGPPPPPTPRKPRPKPIRSSVRNLALPGRMPTRSCAPPKDNASLPSVRGTRPQDLFGFPPVEAGGPSCFWARPAVYTRKTRCAKRRNRNMRNPKVQIHRSVTRRGLGDHLAAHCFFPSTQRGFHDACPVLRTNCH